MCWWRCDACMERGDRTPADRLTDRLTYLLTPIFLVQQAPARTPPPPPPARATWRPASSTASRSSRSVFVSVSVRWFLFVNVGGGLTYVRSFSHNAYAHRRPPRRSSSRRARGRPRRRRSASGCTSTCSRRRPRSPRPSSWPRSSRSVLYFFVHLFPISPLHLLPPTCLPNLHTTTQRQQRADGYRPGAQQDEEGEGEGEDTPLVALRTVAARLAVAMYNEGGTLGAV